MEISAALLLLLAATVSAQFGAKPNNQYEYELLAKLMTGAPDVASQYSGMGLRAKLLVQASAPDILLFKLRDTETAELRNKVVNMPWDKLVGFDADGKEIFPLQWEPVTEMKQLLEQPFKVKHNKGVITDIVVGGNEPEMMVNIKKGIIQRWQMTMNKDVIAQFPSGKFFEDETQPLYWEAPEESVGGLCMAGYALTPILGPHTQMHTIRSFGIEPTKMWGWVPSDIPQRVTTERFMLTKTLLHHKCKNRMMVQHMAPAPLSCRPDVSDCFNTNANHTTVIRYLMRGRRTGFEMEAMMSHDMHMVFPFQMSTEQLMTMTQQRMVLLGVKPIASPLPEPANARTLKRLMANVLTRDLITPEKPLTKPTLTDAPIINIARPIMPLNTILKKIPMTTMKQRLLETLATIEASFDQVPDPTTRDIPGMINLLETPISMMSFADLMDVYNKIPTMTGRNVHVMKQIFREAIAVAGTNPCIMVIKKLIETKEVVGFEAATLIMYIPMHIKTPTIEIMQELFKMLRNGIPATDEQLMHNTMIAFAKTVNVACIRKATTWNAFPVTLFNEFCNPQTAQIMQSWVPFFEKRLTTEAKLREKMVIVKALSILNHPEVIPIMENIAFNKAENVHVRETAILGMIKFRLINSALVEQIVKPIALDKNEWPQVRMAAMTTLVTINPPLATFHQLAMMTWTENDLQITNFVSTYLEELSLMTEAGIEKWVWEVREKARLVAPLARPAMYADLWTRNTLVRGSMDLLMVAAQIETANYMAPFDIMPFKYHGRFRSYNHMTFLPLGLHTKFIGIQNVIDFMMAPDSVSRINRFHRGSDPVQAVIAELTNVKNLLKLVKRENEPLLVWLHATIMGSMERVFAFDQTMLQGLMTKLRDDDTLKFEMRNFQKVMNLMDHTVAWPTDVGLMMMLYRRAPAVMSLRGEVVLEGKKSADGSRVVRINLKNFQPFVNVKMTAIVSTLNPITMRSLSAGVMHNMMMSLPIGAAIEWDTKSQRVEVVANFINRPNQLNLLRIETWPFTAAGEIMQMQIPMRMQPDTKPMHTRAPTSNVMRWGKEMLGMDLSVTWKSEDDFGDMWDMMRKMAATWHVGNFMTVVPTMRLNLISLTLDTNTATAQKWIVSVARDWFRRHHTLATVNNPEAVPVERIEWLGDKAKYADERHSVVEKEARRELLKRARRTLADVRMGTATAWTVVFSAMGLKEQRWALKWLHVQDPSWLTSKWDVRLLNTPTQDIPHKRELIMNWHISWPRVGRTIENMMMADMFAPIHFTASVAVNNAITQIANIEGAWHQSEAFKTFASKMREVIKCREMRNTGFEHSPICEEAKIIASRLNRIRLDFDINWNVEKDMAKNGIMVKDPIMGIIMSLIREPVSKTMLGNRFTWWNLFTSWLVNRLMPFPHVVRPTELASLNKQRLILEFNPISKTWELLYDNGRMAAKITDIRPVNKLWMTNWNMIYNAKNDWSLGIPFMPFLNTRFGMNAYEDWLDTRNRHVMGPWHHKCVIDERFVKTFDMKTFPTSMASSCWHMIAGDCSEVSTFAVMVKPVGSRRAVRIITSTHILELLPSGVDFYLRVDMKDSRKLPVGSLMVIEAENDAKETEARILKVSGDLVEVWLPLYQARLRIIGGAVELMMDPMWLRNRACGICGDMNGETWQDMVGPKRCLFFHPREFQAAYMADKDCQREPLPNYGDNCIKTKREFWMLK